MPPEKLAEIQTMPKTPTEGRHSVPWIGFISLGVIVVGLLAAAAYYYSQTTQGTINSQELVRNALSLVSNGDYSAAIEAADTAAKNAATDQEYFTARSIADTARFSTGEEANRIAAIRSTKESYVRARGNNFEQARYVNVLLGYLNAGFEKYVFDEVFSGPDFSKFLVPNDRASSIRGLAEHSYELAPSTESLFRIGQWYSDRMRNLYGDWDLSDAEKMEAANEILAILTDADKLLAQELEQTEGRVFQFTIEPRYYFWEAYLYGVVARQKPEYLAQAKESVEKLEQLYATRRDENGNQIDLIATRLPYTYANYAWALYEVKGEAGYEEARTYLDKLIAVIDANPTAHAGYYLSLINKNAALSSEKLKKTYSAIMMYKLTMMHKPFGDFIIKHAKVQ